VLTGFIKEYRTTFLLTKLLVDKTGRMAVVFPFRLEFNHRFPILNRYLQILHYLERNKTRTIGDIFAMSSGEHKAVSEA
jgi:hypothetical protein